MPVVDGPAKKSEQRDFAFFYPRPADEEAGIRRRIVFRVLNFSAVQ